MTITRVADPQSRIESLCAELIAGTGLKKEGRCKRFTNTITNTDQKIDSWKFNEWDYGKAPKVVLPIDARGLFTINDNQIVVRGYDKFFNVGEVASTKREAILRDTTGPYDVTLKENGCIILIGGLSSGDIVVCSKHSTGPRDDLTTNHAAEGESQVARQLSSIGRTPRELALFLNEHNLTAVAELCDDSFEEHVLEYGKAAAGLYLHGLNYNTVEFQTVPIGDVTKFAKEWGFKSVESLRYSNATDLFEFMDGCTNTGTYNGREVEGFVIRAKAHGHDFFFKFKFDQPYLLYRQFREVTRSLLAGKPAASIKPKQNQHITKQYLAFVQALFKDQPQLAENFRHGHDIIKVRKLFLEHIGETNGINLLNIDSLQESMEKLQLHDSDEVFKYVIVPVATISCGKTTVFQTLKNLFPSWEHVQNDNISRNSKIKLAEQCVKALTDAPVVLADRNNAEYRERKQLLVDMSKHIDKYHDTNVTFKYICVNFVDPQLSEKDWWDITYTRTKKRGDNHQSIKSESNSQLAEKVMKGFIARFQPVDRTKKPDSDFDLVIDLELNHSDSSLNNAKRICSRLHEKYPELMTKIPSDRQFAEAFEKALAYKSTYTKNMGPSSPKPRKPAYYGIEIDSRFRSLLDKELANHSEYVKLQEKGRVQAKFHVTLGHVMSRKTSEENRAKWNQLVSILGPKKPSESNESRQPLPFKADIEITNVVISKGKLICATVEVKKVYGDNGVVEVPYINKHLHITVGTQESEIRPMESNNTLDSLGSFDSGEYEVNGAHIEVIKVSEVLEYQQVCAFY